MFIIMKKKHDWDFFFQNLQNVQKNVSNHEKDE